MLFRNNFYRTFVKNNAQWNKKGSGQFIKSQSWALL